MEKKIVDKRTIEKLFVFRSSEKDAQILDNKFVVINLHSKTAKEDAAYIVEACNNYERIKEDNEALLDALKDLLESVKPESIERNKMFGGKVISQYYVGSKGTPSDKSIVVATELLQKLSSSTLVATK